MMNNEELKEALLSSVPVLCTHTDGHESEYKCVSGILYRQKNGRIVVSAEVTDKCGRSVAYCDPERLRVKGGA